jgi:hypothetical protein
VKEESKGVSHMNIEQIATYIKEKRIMEALNEIKPMFEETEKRSLFYWRTQLRSFETVETFYHAAIIRKNAL